MWRGAPYPAITVSGFDDPNDNGTYVLDGTFNNAPRWSNGTVEIVYTTSNYWGFRRLGAFPYTLATLFTNTNTHVPCRWLVSTQQGALLVGSIALTGACGSVPVLGPSCAISNVSLANTTACNDNGTTTGADDYFTADVTVTFAYAPSGGTLTLKRGTTVVATTTGDLTCSTTYTFTGVQMAADGGSIELTAEFSTACTYTSGSLGTAPVSCSCVPSSSTTTISACDSYTWAANGTTYTTSGTFTAVTGGCNTETLNLTITQSGTACNDGNPSTLNDMYDGNCNCVGTPCNTGATINGNTNLCAGAALSIIATGGNQYQWSGPGGYSGSTGGSIVRYNATPAMSGTYSVTITNNDCVTVLTIGVTVHPLPSASLTGTTSVCSGGTIDIAAPAGSTSYQWSGPGGFTSIPAAGNSTCPQQCHYYHGWFVQSNSYQYRWLYSISQPQRNRKCN